MKSCLDYVRDVACELADAVAPGRPLAAAVIRHALDFGTWRSLVARAGLSHHQAVALMVLIEAALADT